jgi:predicted exporter
LSAITTLLSFGLLAISSTAIVHAFGFTVAAGILTALLLAPLVGKHTR